jgi:KaiC/GvpD/RAD55 family RecA-like ATPase
VSAVARTKTGVPGLDEVLEGGLVRNYTYSVIGPPGSGKTLLGTQFLFRGATQFGENGVYASLEETPHSIANNMMRFNFNLFDLESQGKLVLVDAAPSQEQPGGAVKIKGGLLGAEDFDLDGLLGVVAHARKRVAAKRCVIDSLALLGGVYKSEAEYRFKLVQFFRALSELELTTLILTDTKTQSVDNYGIETLLAHGSFVFHNRMEGERVLQLIEIPKMRGIRVLKRLMPYAITQNGFEVRTQEAPYK